MNKNKIEWKNHLIEFVVVFIGITLFLFIPRVFRSLADDNNSFFGPIYYLLRALAILIALPVSLFILKKAI